MRRLYIVGHYQYREMAKSKLTAEREENMDSLPCVMFNCMIKIWANNKRSAMKHFRLIATCKH